MATADWTTLTGGVTDGVAVHGVTSGLPVMTGGAPNIWAFNSSLSTSAGALARKYVGTAPLPVFDKGSIISGAMVRYAGLGTTGFSVFLFSCLGGDSAATSAGVSAYMLGLQDADPCHIVLVKGVINSGLPEGEVGDFGILRRSVNPVSLGEWVHLQLDCAVQANGDVTINCLQNSATSLSDPPNWVSIDGMDEFVDDVTKVNSGTDPLLAGPPGYGYRFSSQQRAAAVDHIRVSLQTTF